MAGSLGDHQSISGDDGILVITGSLGTIRLYPATLAPTATPTVYPTVVAAVSSFLHMLHGIMMGTAFGLMFPLGAMVSR